MTGYFEENTTQEQAEIESEIDTNWDYTAFVGTDKPTVMKVELTDKEGIKTINEYPVTLLD